MENYALTTSHVCQLFVNSDVATIPYVDKGIMGFLLPKFKKLKL